MTNQEKIQIIANKVRNGLIMGYSPFYDFYLNTSTIPAGYTEQEVLNIIAGQIKDGHVRGDYPTWRLSYDDGRED